MPLIACRISSTDAWNLVSGTRCRCLLLLKGLPNVDVPIPSSYVRVTLPLAQLTLRFACMFTVTLMYAHLIPPFLEKLMCMDTGLSHPPAPTEISSNISQGKTCLPLFTAVTTSLTDNSDQDSYPSRRKRRPPRMRAAPHGRDVQVTVTKTIEFDVELRLEGAPAVPRRMCDEESGSDMPELTKEEQRMRSLELQLKQDLEI
jgi:hypothetical protein